MLKSNNTAPEKQDLQNVRKPKTPLANKAVEKELRRRERKQERQQKRKKNIMPKRTSAPQTNHQDPLWTKEQEKKDFKIWTPFFFLHVAVPILLFLFLVGLGEFNHISGISGLIADMFKTQVMPFYSYFVAIIWGGIVLFRIIANREISKKMALIMVLVEVINLVIALIYFWVAKIIS